ncbi:DUF221-domain-containing protein [Lepidopterella palustris CBS 459.81]|uniref:DUF221-domain-containing protein n=1 Tax=Lepidopterella palustris CBS 459.81 TaxID=1314670 RepID=A0A8E2DXN6_9PEZI|nr:DUF221-domain-containing protein [Lepidopterella palustris CBS 459.81]
MKDNSRTCKKALDDPWGTEHPRDTTIQIAFSVTLGLGAFLAFCFLRPRWKELYAARKKRVDRTNTLPELPDSFFGWMLPLWRITEEQVLASAGLDAFVYLAFFKLAIKFLTVTLFFALVVIKPVHDQYPDNAGQKLPINSTEFLVENMHLPDGLETRSNWGQVFGGPVEYTTDYLWMYLAFAYLFTGLAMYLIVSETRRIIEVRQEYLGTQTTITDRTILLSGIPPYLKSEEKIKEFIEHLEIGKVDSVLLCKNWKELDDLIAQRNTLLRKLEEAWAVYLGKNRAVETLPIVQPLPPGPELEGGDEHEDSPLLRNTNGDAGIITPYTRRRPTTKIWSGRCKLHYKNVDAIDYYEEKLHRIDEEIKASRKKGFEPTPLAFVTMDSVASAQMVIQAVLDPSPLQLLARNSPAPSDIVWPNTYLPRSTRMLRAWSITAFIAVLTVFWTIVLVPVAGALNTCSIHEVWPGLADALDSRPNLQSIVNTQLPTLALTLLNVAVPYFYDWLANHQGMISQADIELSLVSKNFFFTFFNFFVIFTALGTASGVVDMFERFGDRLKDTSSIAYALALSLQKLLLFYFDFIILQGFGLFPLRLLEIGSLLLYPINLFGAKTPRDYAKLLQPPIFSYGFFLPQAILIFIICMVYSVLRSSWMVLLSGLAYFMIGHFVHKYQLLYAMDDHQHSTGKGWIMICNRIIIGLVLFQLTTAGQLALMKAYRRSIIIGPLLFATLWFSYVYSRTYKPLMTFIALRSLRRAEHSDLGSDILEESLLSEHRYSSETRNRQTVDEARESGLRFINPSLIMSLENVWVADKSARDGNASVAPRPNGD